MISANTIAQSEGKKNVLQRARLLSEFEWTPIGDIPVYTKLTGKTKLAAGSKQKGMIYSSTEPTDKFITENVSFETFLSAISNPDSALYTKDIDGHNNSWAYFGIVCNGFVRYSFNIRRRFSTKRWSDVPGMRKIADETKFTVDDIEICDVLYAFGKGRNHVALITDVLRDESGVVRKVEVSEAVRPTCVRRQFEPEEFYEKFSLFALWRYDYIDSVPPPDESDVKLLLEDGKVNCANVCVDYGNKSNYRVYEDVVISVFGSGINEIEIYKNSEFVEKLTISGKGKILRRFTQGYYRVVHIKSGDCTEFCVCDPAIDFEVDGDEITVRVDACDPHSRILYMEFREGDAKPVDCLRSSPNNALSYYSERCAPLSKVEELTDKEKNDGIIKRRIPSDAHNFKIYFENKYGVWTHTMIAITQQ